MLSFLKRHKFIIGLFGVVFFSLLPLLLYANILPCKDDADGYLGMMEALRRSIFEYHEFPFWNPWSHGGIPLFADNNAPLFALEMPCVMLFGVFYGIRISFLLYGLLAAFGTYLFLGDYTQNRPGRFYGACIFSLMGGFSMHNINGHEVFLGFCYLPLLLWLVHRLGDKKWYYSAGAGIVAGLLINHEIHYPSLFSITVACCFALSPLFKHWKDGFFWRNVALGASATLAIGGYRLILSSAYLKDYPREMSLRMSVHISKFIQAIVVPFQNPSTVCGTTTEMPGTNGKIFAWEWHELGCYVGIIALCFAIYSLMHQKKWYHWAVLLTALLTIDCSCPLLPGYWLREIPAFKSCFVMTRWRFVMVLFIALCAAKGVEFALNDKLLKRKTVLTLIGISCFAMMANQTWTYMYAIPPTTETLLLTPPKGVPARGNNEFITMSIFPFQAYYCTKNNICNRAALVPVQPYFHIAHYASTAFPSSSYQGELYGDGITLLKQTPNRYVFKAEKATQVTVNSNPGSYWHISGTKLFPQYRTFEEEKSFVFNVPGKGVYVLYAKSPVHEKGVCVAAGGAIAFAVILLIDLLLRRHKKLQTTISV